MENEALQDKSSRCTLCDSQALYLEPQQVIKCILRILKMFVPVFCILRTRRGVFHSYLRKLIHQSSFYFPGCSKIFEHNRHLVALTDRQFFASLLSQYLVNPPPLSTHPSNLVRSVQFANVFTGQRRWVSSDGNIILILFALRSRSLMNI